MPQLETSGSQKSPWSVRSGQIDRIGSPSFKDSNFRAQLLTASPIRQVLVAEIKVRHELRVSERNTLRYE